MSPGPMQRTNQQNKGASWQISYLIQMNKTGRRSQTLHRIQSPTPSLFDHDLLKLKWRSRFTVKGKLLSGLTALRAFQSRAPAWASALQKKSKLGLDSNPYSLGGDLAPYPLDMAAKIKCMFLVISFHVFTGKRIIFTRLRIDIVQGSKKYDTPSGPPCVLSNFNSTFLKRSSPTVMRLDGRQHLPQIDFFSEAASVYLSKRPWARPCGRSSLCTLIINYYSCM